MRRLALFALAGSLAGSLVACSMDSTGPSGSVEGSYTLQRINGQYLPYTFSSGRQLTSDRLVLYPDGSFDELSRYSDGSSTLDEGEYSGYNGSLTFYYNTGDVYQGSVSRDVLTQVGNGFTQVFQRD
jgi:hypothetical protein